MRTLRDTLARLGSLLAIAAPGCEAADEDADPFADAVVELSSPDATTFGHAKLPDIVLGPPGGVYDVASLGCEGSIVLELDPPGIVDGPGPDLIVFENPFDGFPEPGEVSVSDDGETWMVFPCDPVSLLGCAGVTATLAVPDSGIDPTDPSVAGGDSFDLAALPESPTAVRFVRIEDRSRAYWEALGGLSYCDPGNGGSGGFDLDAIAAVH
jgi:hypothetical protein